MIDAEFDRAAQEGEGGIAVIAQAFELHGAESDTGNGAAGERAGAAGTSGSHGSPVLVR
ncbi:hypothetical protein GCM10022380_14700 [Amycolatopsis tucumanensis]|uniref:Uncharacterized protein n=1 Tax=Amycolatopsis tucumanensis TaxID=401106 RepID=A0ABP7HPX8_9PSEU